MITGSIYLGKKATKAYRKHQAEKAASKLTSPISINDPSDEIRLKVPPSSPTNSSATGTPISTQDSTSLSRLASSNSVPELDANPTQSPHPKATEAHEFNNYVQRHSVTEEPPSYDIVISTGTSDYRPQNQHAVSPRPASRPTSEHSSSTSAQQTFSPVSTYLGPSSTLSSPPSALSSDNNINNNYSDRFQRDCQTCLTMMEQFQTIYPHPHRTLPATQAPPRSIPQIREESSVAELHDGSVYQQRPVPEATGTILEAPDTAISTAVEMPAELPSQLVKSSATTSVASGSVHS